MSLLDMTVYTPVILQGNGSLCILCLLLAAALLLSLIVTFGLLFDTDTLPAARAWLYCMCKRRPRPVVIEIFESPRPTMMPCSPFKPTPTATMRRALRRGGRRGPSHRRASTAIYNPTLAHHCGNSLALRLAGMKGHMRAVRRLRSFVADKVEKMYLRGDSLHDMDVRDIIP